MSVDVEEFRLIDLMASYSHNPAACLGHQVNLLPTRGRRNVHEKTQNCNEIQLVGLAYVFGARLMLKKIARQSDLVVRSRQSSTRAYWRGLGGTMHEAPINSACQCGFCVLNAHTSPCDHAPRGAKSNLPNP